MQMDSFKQSLGVTQFVFDLTLMNCDSKMQQASHNPLQLITTYNNNSKANMKIHSVRKKNTKMLLMYYFFSLHSLLDE